MLVCEVKFRDTFSLLIVLGFRDVIQLCIRKEREAKTMAHSLFPFLQHRLDLVERREKLLFADGVILRIGDKRVQIFDGPCEFLFLSSQ